LEITPSAILSAKRGLAAIQSALSKAASYEYESLYTTTLSEEFIKILPEHASDKVRQYRVRGKYLGAEGVVHQDTMSAEGMVLSTRSYFIGKDSVVVTDNESGSSATILPTQPVREAVLPPRVDAPLLIFGFLQEAIDNQGIRLITPSNLQSPEGWAKVVQGLASARSLENGDLQVTLERERDILIIDFTRAPNEGQLWPRALKVTTKNHALIDEVRVLEFMSDPDRPGIPKKLALITYSPQGESDKSLHVATWVHEVVKAVSGGPVDQNEFEFDASSVNEIWDGSSGVRVIVPH
jgi:hypothetical protein